MYKVSIIIPHYNSIKLLENLLESIPNMNEIQVIVVDDNSTKDIDYYNQLIQKFPNWEFLKNTSENKGAGAARNIGLKNAEGEWLLFADADDFFVKGFYEKINQQFATECDIIFFTPTSMELDTKYISDRHIRLCDYIENYLSQYNHESEYSLRYKFIVPWSKLIRRSLVQENDIFFRETMVSNDVMFSVKCGYYAKKIAAVKDIIYCVTTSKGSLTTSVNSTNLNTRLDMLIESKSFLESVLDAKTIKGLNITGKTFILQIIHGKLGFKTLIITYRKLKRNHINLIVWDDFNIFKISDKLRFINRAYKKGKKYIKRD